MGNNSWDRGDTFPSTRSSGKFDKIKKEKRELTRIERLSWFSTSPKNEVLEKDGFIFYKHWDGNKNRWTVSQFSKQAWQNMRGVSYRQEQKLEQQAEMEKASKELEVNY